MTSMKASASAQLHENMIWCMSFLTTAREASCSIDRTHTEKPLTQLAHAATLVALYFSKKKKRKL